MNWQAVGWVVAEIGKALCAGLAGSCLGSLVDEASSVRKNTSRDLGAFVLVVYLFCRLKGWV